MKIAIARKHADHLVPTPIVHQTAFWGRVHRRLGFSVDAFDVELSAAGTQDGDFLVVRAPLSAGADYAYVPFGPELAPPSDDMGRFLEQLSVELQPMLGPTCAFIRWDLPWEAVHARDAANFDDSGAWRGPPAKELRELRMNIGTTGNLWKAPRDLLAPDTVIVDLLETEDVLLARMHPKTRYNVRLAERRGVVVTEGNLADLRDWYAMYLETTARHAIEPMSFGHAEVMLGERADDTASPTTTKLLLARHDGRLLAGMLLALTPARASYLYGASTRAHRELMGSYALQWAAIRTAKAHGCREYDLLGAAPRGDAAHPLAGVHRFKAGFGGRLLHREGCWDFPFDGATYRSWYLFEQARIAASITRRADAPRDA
ncbi:MAG: peptidoglycan bridge formation glycyltransferase FemA/FemB family protein [Myxococcales bacterium]|nr:peptidoglycan bridge formation glycyltransferase FemA/FemB family protein [Myxococcales bacterium]